MCRPTYFDVAYTINPWMDPAKPVDPSLAVAQWERLRAVYRSLGHEVLEVPAAPGLPDMVFAANGATTVDGRALVARFRYAERSTESSSYLDWFGARRWPVRQAEFINEGQGDFLLAEPYLLAGTGFRTEPAAHAEAARYLGRAVVRLTLVDPRFYHLDTALAVLSPGEIAYYPPAFSRESQAVLRMLFPGALTADPHDAEAFGLNAVSDGRHVVVSNIATGLIDALASRGFEPIGVDLSELRKAGGAAKCCTLELHG
jgi:N-dimethylarginine dimethylaminohydrolase